MLPLHLLCEPPNPPPFSEAYRDRLIVPASFWSHTERSVVKCKEGCWLATRIRGHRWWPTKGWRSDSTVHHVHRTYTSEYRCFCAAKIISFKSPTLIRYRLHPQCSKNRHFLFFADTRISYGCTRPFRLTTRVSWCPLCQRRMHLAGASRYHSKYSPPTFTKRK